MANIKICMVSRCETNQYGKEPYCRRHYRQLQEGTLILEERKCKNCDAVLPISARSDQLFCKNNSCLMQYHRKNGCYTKEKVLASRGSCTIPECNEPIHANNLCKIHDNKRRRNGDPLISKKKIKGKCIAIDCTNIHVSRGFCMSHYRSFMAHGDPMFVENNKKRYKEAKSSHEYMAWQSMKTRCNNPNASNYYLYGAKGIKVFPEWENDFWKFIADVGKIPEKGYHLSRKDHKKNYEPGNVEWRTAKENSQYHSGATLTYEKANEIRNMHPEKTMQQIAVIFGITTSQVHRIMKNNAWNDAQYIPEENRRRIKITDEIRLKIKKLHSEGSTYDKISKLVRYSVSAIQGIVNNGYIGEKAAHPLYRRWQGMRARCQDKNHSSFHNYGGRGITVCSRWTDFWLFVEDVSPIPTPIALYSLDRIDPNGNYEPSNFRWATRSEQNKNKSKINKKEDV